METRAAIRARRAIKHFDPKHQLTDEEKQEMQQNRNPEKEQMKKAVEQLELRAKTADVAKVEHVWAPARCDSVGLEDDSQLYPGCHHC